MEDFPTQIELNVAAALLLLSHPPPTPPPPPPPPPPSSSFTKLWTESYSFMESDEKSKKRRRPEEEKEKNFEATPCDSSLTSENSVRAHRMKLMADAASRCRLMQLKVARRARSKVIYTTMSERKAAPAAWSKPQVIIKPKATPSSETTTGTAEGSCLSTGGTSEVFSGRNRSSAVMENKNKTRRRMGSTHIRRRAEAIIKLLSRGGCASEVRIRQLLGDSPDTSKALRMLLRMEEVKRSGAGGRADPFIYRVAAGTGSSQNSALETPGN